jgi:hypothetical protein
MYDNIKGLGQNQAQLKRSISATWGVSNRAEVRHSRRRVPVRDLEIRQG